MRNHLQLAVARQNAHSQEAAEKRSRTLAFNRKLDEENVIALRREGLVPVAIADRLRVGVGRVREILIANGLEPYGFVSWEPAGPRPHCPNCGH